MAIARNKAIDARRQRTNECWDEEAAAAIADPADNPEAVMQKKDTGAVMRHCLTQLSPAHREIVDLVYYHGKTIEEVAEITGITQATVKTRMFYARKRLACLLDAHGITRTAA
jgi:RNA polymerase sigma-70 factor (ECF subfamily)